MIWRTERIDLRVGNFPASQDQDVFVRETDPGGIDVHQVAPFFLVHGQGLKIGYFQSLALKGSPILTLL